MLADEYLPAFDISDSMAVVVNADRETTWRALMDLDLIEVGRDRPLIAVLGVLRMTPEIISRLLRGQGPPAQPERLSLRDTAGLPGRRAAGPCSTNDPPRKSRSA